MTPLAFSTTAYDRARHEGFVKASWCKGAREAWEVLASRLRRPDVSCLVAHQPGDPDNLLGWVAVAPRGVIWAYTRDLFGRLRRRGLMTSLLMKVGVDVSQPTPCLFWSPDAADIAARGYGFIYAPRGLKEAA